MTVLLAREFAPGRYQAVLQFRCRKDGKGELPLKWNGSIESLAVRDAARFFAAEPKARDVNYEFNASCKFRVTRVD